jgi:uncharacterized protein YqjF (DUF2071 family)
LTTHRQHDFRSEILTSVAHRPWPMPNGPWILTQTWHDLLFAHWPVQPDELRARIPSSFRLDLFNDQAWLGIVSFEITNAAPRAMPALPWISAFPEVNVRTYVTVGDKPGVYFFSLDAANALAVRVARRLFHLPYYLAAMDVTHPDNAVEYRSRRRDGTATFDARYRPLGNPVEPMRGSLEHFLTERYCLYNTDRAGRAYRLDIHHPPWPLQVAEATIRENTMAIAAGLRVPGIWPLLHFAKRQDTVSWPPVTVASFS